ncbi:hypothetical protein BTA31_16645 [Bacillus haynesii]|uniref:Uncharacterized protein n=2 Tax=Bacillus haynesii TaxID=1925021 RepID=A0ABX3I1V6_9BACI|nr:hypothetical protein BTA31_16645 [Bacillus haynesii]
MFEQFLTLPDSIHNCAASYAKYICESKRGVAMKQDQSKHAFMYDADGDKETVQQISDAYFSGFVAHDDAQPLADADKQ